MSFNAADPFSFGNMPPPNTSTQAWGNVDTQAGGGASSAGHGLQTGTYNSGFPVSNAVPFGSATTILVGAFNNAAVCVLNEPSSEPVAPSSDGLVGIYGAALRPREKGGDYNPHRVPDTADILPMTRSIGVAGSVDAWGAGVFGITGSTPAKPPSRGINQHLGIGVAGWALELSQPADNFEGSGLLPGDLPTALGSFEGSVGVLGISQTGVGVRGHAGDVLHENRSIEAPAVGAVFSAGVGPELRPPPKRVGSRAPTPPFPSAAPPLPQVRIVPAAVLTLPAVGHLGDLYMLAVVEEGSQSIAPVVTCKLFLCVKAGRGTFEAPTSWAELLQGPAVCVTGGGL
jgi:hypothetical protein